MSPPPALGVAPDGARQIAAQAQLVADLGVADDLVRRIERWGLITPLARPVEGPGVYYDASARQTIERVLTLIAAGYAERDIALVVGRVTLDVAADPKRLPRLLTLAQLATRAAVAPASLTAWIDQGLVVPWAIDPSGAPYFERDVEPLVQALVALGILGLGALIPAVAPALAAPASPQAQALRAELARHLEAVSGAVEALRALTQRLTPKRRGRLLRRKKAPTMRLTVRSS